MQERQPVDNWVNLAMLELAWPRREGSAESAVFRSKPWGADHLGGEVCVKQGALGTHSGSRGKCLTPEVSLPCVYLFIDNLEDPLAFLEKLQSMRKYAVEWGCGSAPFSPDTLSFSLHFSLIQNVQALNLLVIPVTRHKQLPQRAMWSQYYTVTFSFFLNKQLLFNLRKNLNKQKEQKIISKHLCPPPGASRCEYFAYSL